MNIWAQVAIVVFSGIFSWSIAGWVTVNVMKYQMGQFAGEIRDINNWRTSFEQRYSEHRIANAERFSKIEGKLPGSQLGD